MLSEEKIKKMIRLSDYENGLGSTDLKRTRYMKTDYVRLQILKTVMSVIAAGGLAAVLFVLYHVDGILYNAYSFPWKIYFVAGGAVWIVLLVAEVIFTCVRASHLYEESKNRVAEYDKTLHELTDLYEKEEWSLL